MSNLNSFGVLLGVLLALATILGGILRLLVLVSRTVRTHQQLVANVALLLADRPKYRRRLRRIETELDLRPRSRARVTTTTTATTQTHESEPLPA